MKFRNLKKGQWAIQFDYFQQFIDEHFECQLFCNNGTLFGFAVSEYDNGLYIETSTYQFFPTWKELKWNLTHYNLRHQKFNRMPYYVYKFNGKCDKCGCPVDFVRDFGYGWKCSKCEIKDLAECYGEDPDECWQVECEMEKELHNREWKNGEWVDISSNLI